MSNLSLKGACSGGHGAGGGAGQLVPIKPGSWRIPWTGIRAGPGPIQEARAPESLLWPEHPPPPVATDARDPSASSGSPPARFSKAPN